MFFSSGSIQGYVKNMSLQQKWNEKKKNPFQVQEDKLKSIGAPVENKDSTKLSGIIMRLQSGKKLSPDDMDYLRRHNPEMYAKAKAVMREREAYEQSLRRCRSKEEVRQLHSSKAASLVSGVSSSGGGGSSAPAGDGLMRVSHISDEHHSFITGSQYQKLPESERKKKQA